VRKVYGNIGAKMNVVRELVKQEVLNKSISCVTSVGEEGVMANFSEICFLLSDVGDAKNY
jgi:hypothetical protein